MSPTTPEEEVPDPTKKVVPESGEFPYPLTDGPEESRYLTWVRNHSNYMAERGLSDYFRLVAVLVRGIAVNFLTLLPFLLLAALFFGLVYNRLLDDWNERTTLTIGGTWSAGEALTTTLTTEDGSTTESVVTEVKSTPEEAQIRHLNELQAASGLFDEFLWTGHESGIVARPAKSGNSVLVSVSDTSNDGTYTYGLPPTKNPHYVTPIVFAIGIVWVLLFPIVARISKIRSYKKTLETGSSSSVKTRDLFERSFGFLLLALLALALIESFPLLVHYFHKLRVEQPGWTLPTIGTAVAFLISANKVLPALGGVAKKLGMVFVGGLGLLVPLLVILYVVDFLVYRGPYGGLLIITLAGVPLLLAGALVFAIIAGRKSFKGSSRMKLCGLLAGMICMFLAVIVLLILLFFDSDDGEIFGEYGRFIFVLAWTVEIWLFCTLTVDVNLTSINGLYRDRLASAFLVGADTKGDVDIEEDIDLQEICHYDAGSKAPYHLVNVALNLQGSKDIAIRERNSDFFIFSKRFIGGKRTGYCRSENMEQVYPQIDLGTAMAISAAAASPNMGRGTNPLMVAFLTLLNIRLGFWIPNPDPLEKDLDPGDPRGKDFGRDVFPAELDEIACRREQAYQSKTRRPLAEKRIPCVEHNLIGIGFSGGGIRSATVNLGIAQALHQQGVFDHIDYMSTVSGGGYLGSSISTLMRCKSKLVSDVSGKVSIDRSDPEKLVVRVVGSKPGDEAKPVEEYAYSYTKDAQLDEEIEKSDKENKPIKAGQRILKRATGTGEAQNSLWDRFKWRVRPRALWHEMLSKLDETHKWVNLSDGGHIENLATIELLRRRCRFIITGDGEADPKLHFNGLATLIRYARIDLGIHIDIDLENLRLKKADKRDKTPTVSSEHWALGTITYPEVGNLPEETGYLLYLKSSFTGDEDEVIQEYRHRNPAFPHESTADQFFDEGQFEAYRALGEHIGRQALATSRLADPKDPCKAFSLSSFEDVENWFDDLKNAAREENS